jgi:hypothetical protein
LGWTNIEYSRAYFLSGSRSLSIEKFYYGTADWHTSPAP